ncbi:MAG: tetratricopeptide repeat protein [Deinococcales bacterium]|nr:tetratricopeptide repeat protein [Deinococcales bacterium]
MMLRRRFPFLFALLAIVSALPGAALAQGASEPTRVVILPFDTDAAVSSYQLGLPTALQHALNQLPGLYVPPVGDAALVANKATDSGQDVQALLGRLFDADAVVTGRVTTGGGGVVADINVALGGAVTPHQVSGADPAALAVAAAEAVARAVRPQASADALASVRVAAEQTPSVPSLSPTGLAASGLPGARVADLNTAAQLDAGSAWVVAEYARALALAGELEEAVTQARRAAELAPSDAEVQALVGVVLDAAGAEGALEAFERALAVNPAHAVALAGRAAVSVRTGATDTDPTADLEAAIAAYPRFVDAYVRLAGRQQNAQRALQVLRRAESHSPESVLLRGSVMRRLLDANDAAGAATYLSQTVADPVARSASMYALARLLPASQAAAAEALLAEGRELYPDSVDLKLAQAERLLQSGDLAGAEGLLGPLYTQNPNSVAVANLLAVVQAQRGDLEGARRTVEALRGQGADVDRTLAELYLASGRAAGALALLEQLVAEEPEDAHLQALYGTALMRLGRLEQGETVLERALELDPESQLAGRSLELLRQQRELTGGDVTFNEEAGVAFQQGLYALDVNDFVAAVDAFGRSRAAQETGLGAFYQGYARQLAGDPRGALADYGVALESFPDSDIVLNNLGYAQLEVGRFDLALDSLRRAIAANPENAQAHLNLGVAYYAVQRYEDAIAAFAEAGRLDPGLSPTAETLIEDVRERLGQR